MYHRHLGPWLLGAATAPGDVRVLPEARAPRGAPATPSAGRISQLEACFNLSRFLLALKK